MMNLPYRLKRIVAHVPEDSRKAADIGCDHAYVAIELVHQHKVEKVLACDVREGPLRAAERNIRAAGVSDQVETRLGDGLHPVRSGEVDTVIIAGIGGELMIRILDGRLGDFKRFILSPQSELSKVRRFLTDNGMEISDEEMLTDEGKYYVIMSCTAGNKTPVRGHAQYEYTYGWKLLEKKSPVLRAYLLKEQERYLGILKKTQDPVVLRDYMDLTKALEVYK